MVSFDALQQHILDNEENLPENLSELTPWVQNISEEVDKKKFTMMFEISRPIKKLREALFTWMGQVGSFSKNDTITSSEISCIGFFVNFHPDHNNRDKLKRTLTEFLLQKLGKNIHMSVFFTWKGWKPSYSNWSCQS